MAKATARREQIMDFAAELFAEKGVGGTTVREIGERAGVFSGSLYHYFPSKDALVQEILSRYMADIERRFGRVVEEARTPWDTVRGLIHETLEVIETHPHPTAIYQQNRQYLREHGLLEAVDTASREMRSHWLRALSAGVADGTFRSDVPTDIFYRAVRDSLWASMHWPSRAEYTTEAFTDLLTTLFFDGFVLSRPSRGNGRRIESGEEPAVAGKFRSELRADLKSGRLTLGEVFRRADTDELLGTTNVMYVLESLPKIGKSKARGIAESVGIAESGQISGLAPSQRADLLARIR